MADIIQLRRDTAANWTSQNPTLANGEVGYETDTNKLKIGDGSTVWTSLSYWGGTDTSALHVDVANEITGITLKGTPHNDDEIIIEDSEAGYIKKSITIGTLPAGGGGETNTMSSEGVGTSVYYQKDGVNLELNAIKSENDRLGVALDGVSHDVELTINEGNIVHDNISGGTTDNAHHTKYLDSDTEAVITAEIVDGQSIDNAIDSLISNHAGDDNAHHEVIEQSDVDTSISTHTGDDNAHHEVFESLVDDTTPTQGGPLDENEKGIELTTNLTSNTTYSGIIAPYIVSGLTFGQLVYISGNHACSLADADAVGTMPVVGMYVGTNLVLTHGFARQDTWTWTAGQRIYCGTDGNPTSTPPGGIGDYIQIIGVANSVDEIQVMPSLTEVKYK